MHAIIHGGTYQPLTYSGSITNWASNSDADEFLYDHAFVDVVYSADSVLKTGTTTHWQREHAFCASLMTGSPTGSAVKFLGRATDYHNLFASSTNGNTSRGNKNYGNADRNGAGFINRLTSGGEDGYCYDTTTFEPGNHDKGRLSRAIFYMATMYCEDEYDTANNVTMKGLQVVEGNVPFVSGNECAFAIGNLSTLLSWSELPVDLTEYRHNESVYSYVPEVHSDPNNNVAQGNRNPYVDFPGLVDYVFGSKKNDTGSLNELMSSYQSLEIGGEGTAFYAIDEAKRQYNDGDLFHLSDISLVAVSHNLEETPFTGFTVTGAVDGQEIEWSGSVTLTIHTPINEIPYSVLVETDPVDSAIWKHKVTAKSAGNDFYGISSNPGVAHTLDFDGVNWDVTYAAGAVGNNNSNLGATFGTSTAPVNTLTFITTNDFTFNGKSSVTGIYLRGGVASGCTYNVQIKVGETLVGNFQLTYIDTKTPVTVGTMLTQPLTGKISIVISNITKAVYVQYLAVHAE